MNLDQFINYKSPIPQYFFTDWTSPNPTTSWSFVLPKKVTYNSSVIWKDAALPITVCCLDTKDYCTMSNSDPYAPRHIPMLKSLLQKCIRRGYEKQAVQAAKHLIQLDISCFLRRLCVIMIEDVTLHESFSTLTWLVSAVSKGYQITNKQLNWLLGVVQYLSKEISIEPISNQLSDPTNRQLILKLSNDLTSKNQVLLSLMFRLSYGGMKNDIDMFYQSLNIWLKLPNIPKNDSIEPVDFLTIEALDRNQIISCCADYHCYPMIIQRINLLFPHFTIEEIKRCIWECSSRLNFRKNQKISQTSKNIWIFIREDIIRLQNTYVKIN